MIFAQEGTKEYVFRRMKKQIILELALCLVQDLLSGGVERASSLEIQIEKCSAGNKKAVISTKEEESESFDEFPLDPSFDWNIDEAFFCLHDKSGVSPDSKIISGQGRAAPYSRPAADGSFASPTKQNEATKMDKV